MRRLAFLLSLLLLPIPALAQSGATRFQLAVPGYAFAFPRDHGAHDEFRTEWWYFTGHLRHDSGERFGYELTFFRHRIDDTTRTFEPNPSAWAAGNVFFAHFAVTDVSRRRFVYETRLHRPVAGLAGASATDCHVFIEDWTLDREGEGFRIFARGADYAIELDLAAAKPLVIQGVDGVSQKSDGLGQASHYISFTRLETSGRLRRDGQWLDVRGQSWMDHEFGSNQLGPNQIGWDWFSVQLDNGVDIMLYEMRRDDGRRDPHSSGTWVDPSGEAEHLTGETWSVRPKRFWTSPHTGAVYPMGWIVEIPGRGLILHVDPVLEDQELGDHNYWEGAVDVSGSVDGETVSGAGYVEMAGYAGRLRGL